MLLAVGYSLTERRAASMSVQVTLTPAQREVITQLGSSGSGGEFDPAVISQLFTLGIVEIQPDSRRLVLTLRGLEVYRVLHAKE